MERPLEAQKHGAVIHDTLDGMLENAEFIISVVPDDAAVRDVYLNDAMLKAVKPGSVIIEMTSCSPEAVRAVQDYYRSRGVSVIDAPITGALPKAIDGTLTIMGAGAEDDFQRAAPIFDDIAEKVFNLGEVGNGKLVKSMTNLLGAINLAAVGEFYRFATAKGLDLDLLAEVVAVSAGGSTQFSRNFSRISEGRFEPAAFTLALLRKDMGIALDCAASSPELSLPLAECAYGLFKASAANDKKDCSAIALTDTLQAD
jgi:2-hydroxy-3-oxopropionate reductase